MPHAGPFRPPARACRTAPDARSFIMGLTPEESLAVLGQRAEALLDRVSQFDNELASFGS